MTNTITNETMHLNVVIFHFMERRMFATAHYLMDIKHSFLRDAKSEPSVSMIDAQLHIDVAFLRRHFTIAGEVTKTFRELQSDVTTYMW